MYETLFKKIFFPLYETHIKGRKTLEYKKELDKNEWLGTGELKEKQWIELKNLLKHAYKNSFFYSDLFDKHGITPEGIKSFSDFQKIPVISKEDIRGRREEFIAENYRGKVIYKSTGGSTGIPLDLAHDHTSYEWRIATFLRGYGWAGCEDGRKLVYVWGAHIGKVPFLRCVKENLHNAFLRRRIFNSFQFDTKHMNACIRYINRAKPQGMVGYATAVYNLAKYIKETNKQVAPIVSIVTGAEKVHEHQRLLIEEVFQGKVFNTYGCREFMLIASECEEHKGLHVNVDNLVVEVLKDGKPAVSGEVGEIVITDLHNYGMPFIRYKNGDLAVASDRQCPCGRGLPLIEDVEGRLLDTIQTADGRMVPGEFFPHLMKEFSEVKKFQVVQKTLERVDINIIPEKAMPDSRLAFLKGEVKKTLGDGVDIRFNFVDDIPSSESGKYRVTISNVPVNF